VMPKVKLSTVMPSGSGGTRILLTPQTGKGGVIPAGGGVGSVPGLNGGGN